MIAALWVFEGGGVGCWRRGERAQGEESEEEGARSYPPVSAFKRSSLG